MKRWNSFLFTGMVFCMFSPTALWAVDDQMAAIEYEEPVFQNAAQLERALNLTAASFTEEDMEAARQQATEEATEEINTLAENYADGVVDQIASDYAHEEVKQLSRDHALNSVDTEDFPNLDERATFYADKYVKEKANEYASSLGFEEGTPDYEEAYNKAIERATDPTFNNLWDTTYAEAISKALDEEAFSDWKDAYSYAWNRGTAEGDWENALETAYNEATDRAINGGIWQESFDYAIARATNRDYSNAYQAFYKKALEEAVVEINAGQLREIYQMRYVYRYGWGVINKKLALKAYHNGLGNIWKHDAGPSLDDEIIPPGPQEFGELNIEKEIAEATRRNTKTGWGNNDEFHAKGNKNKRRPAPRPVSLLSHRQFNISWIMTYNSYYHHLLTNIRK